MMCCAIAGLVMAALAAYRGLTKSAMARLSQARWAVIALAAGLVLAGGAGLAASGPDRSNPGQDGVAAILLLHICGEYSVSPAN